MVRQRDTLRQLLQSTGNDLDAARKTYAQSLGAASPGQPGAGAVSPQPAAAGAAAAGGDGGAGGGGAGGPDFRALHADMEQQMRDYKTEAAKTQEMLSTDVSGVGLYSGGMSRQEDCRLDTRHAMLCSVACLHMLLLAPSQPASVSSHQAALPAHASLLLPQLARAREEASAAKSEASRARAEAEFERDRSGRLSESVEMQRQQVGGGLLG